MVVVVEQVAGTVVDSAGLVAGEQQRTAAQKSQNPLGILLSESPAETSGCSGNLEN